MCSRALLAVLFTTTASVSGTAHAGGFGIPEYGIRRTSMAAVIGRPDEPSCLFHNPAGLVLQKGWRVYLVATGSVITTEFNLRPWDQSNRFLGREPEADGYYPAARPERAYGAAPMIAITGELLPGKLTAGFTAYVGNAAGASFDPDGVTRYHLIEGYIVAPQAVVGAAYRITDKISVGATAGALYMALKGKREVFPIINGMDISSIGGTRAMLELEGSGVAPTWSVAVFGQPHPKVTFGATLIGRIDTTIEGPVKITYSDDAPVPGDTLIGTFKTKQMLPWALLAGVNVDVHPNLELGTELRYWLYRQYDKQRIEATGIFLVRELETVKNWHDSWQISGGLRLHSLPRAPGLEVMLGSHFDRSPAPPETLTLDQPTFDHIGLHSGVRYSFGRYRLGLSYVHYWYDIPTVSNSTTTPPANFKGRGQNNIVALSIEAQI